MKKPLHILALALLTAILSACEIPFELRQDAQPKIYLQGIASGDSVVVTPLYAAPITTETAVHVPSLRVELRVNGELRQAEQKEGRAPFVSRGLALQEGDEVEVTVSGEGLQATGLSFVPHQPRIEHMEWEEVQIDSINAIRVRLTLDEAPGEDDFYGIRIPCRQTYYYLDGHEEQQLLYFTPGYILSAADSGSFDLEDFLQLNYDGNTLGSTGAYVPLTLLTRKQFEGKVYSFYLNSFDAGILQRIRDSLPEGETGMAGGGIVSGEVGGDPGGNGEKDPWDPENLDPSQIFYAIDSEYRFEILRLSPEFFYYAKALYQSNFDFLSNMGLTPANFTYTNVEGGLGFVGAESRTLSDAIVIKETIDLPQDQFPDFPYGPVVGGK